MAYRLKSGARRGGTTKKVARAHALLIVPDSKFTISVYGSSFNYLFYSVLYLLLCFLLPFSAYPRQDGLPRNRKREKIREKEQK